MNGVFLAYITIWKFVQFLPKICNDILLFHGMTWIFKYGSVIYTG